MPLQVREALTLLDLDVLIYPCPKGGTTFRPRARELSGKEQFPFLVDPNRGAKLVTRVWSRLVGLGSYIIFVIVSCASTSYRGVS